MLRRLPPSGRPGVDRERLPRSLRFAVQQAALAQLEAELQTVERLEAQQLAQQRIEERLGAQQLAQQQIVERLEAQQSVLRLDDHRQLVRAVPFQP